MPQRPSVATSPIRYHGDQCRMGTGVGPWRDNIVDIDNRQAHNLKVAGSNPAPATSQAADFPGRSAAFLFLPLCHAV